MEQHERAYFKTFELRAQIMVEYTWTLLIFEFLPYPTRDVDLSRRYYHSAVLLNELRPLSIK